MPNQDLSRHQFLYEVWELLFQRMNGVFSVVAPSSRAILSASQIPTAEKTFDLQGERLCQKAAIPRFSSHPNVGWPQQQNIGVPAITAAVRLIRALPGSLPNDEKASDFQV
jgi:hypothetical protein